MTFKIFAFLLIAILFIPTYAFADQYIPFIGIAWQHTPDVCILDNSLREQYQSMALNTTKYWYYGLNHLTHSHNWNMTLRVVDKVQMANCDITFIYDLEQHDFVDTGHKGKDGHPIRVAELGMTICNNDGYIYQIPYHCTISMHVLSMDDKMLKRVSLHEFGHALGLGHRTGDNRADAIAAFLSDDIMYAYDKPFAHLTNDDILALIHLYGAHGFNGNDNIPDNYTITHPTHIKEYCNGANATVKICVVPINIK